MKNEIKETIRAAKAQLRGAGIPPTPELIHDAILQMLAETDIQARIAEIGEDPSDEPDHYAADYEEGIPEPPAMQYPGCEEPSDEEYEPPAMKFPGIEEVNGKDFEPPALGEEEPPAMKRPGIEDLYGDKFRPPVMESEPLCMEDDGPQGEKPRSQNSFADKKSKELYELIVSLSRHTGYAFCGDGYLAEELGVDRTWVRSTLKCLELDGALRVENPHSKKRRIFLA